MQTNQTSSRRQAKPCSIDRQLVKVVDEAHTGQTNLVVKKATCSNYVKQTEHRFLFRSVKCFEIRPWIAKKTAI
jgi:hypothetical protein